MCRKRFDCELSCNYIISFLEPERAQAYYIDGDWKENFYEVDDLEDLAEHISLGLFNEPDNLFERDPKDPSKFRRGFSRFVEGFGRFVRDGSPNKYELDEEFSQYGGGIVVTTEDLRNQWTTEVVEPDESKEL